MSEQTRIEIGKRAYVLDDNGDWHWMTEDGFLYDTEEGDIDELLHRFDSLQTTKTQLEARIEKEIDCHQAAAKVVNNQAARIAQLEAERDVMQEVVEAVKPISEACWDSEHGEWTFSDHDVIKLREKCAALSELEE